VIGRNPGSGIRYREQSLRVQVRIPFTQRAVRMELETPYGHMARMMRADGINHPAAGPQAEPEPEADLELEAGL
jgi:hypothetical protein